MAQAREHKQSNTTVTLSGPGSEAKSFLHDVIQLEFNDDCIGHKICDDQLGIVSINSKDNVVVTIWDCIKNVLTDEQVITEQRIPCDLDPSGEIDLSRRRERELWPNRYYPEQFNRESIIRVTQLRRHERLLQVYNHSDLKRPVASLSLAHYFTGYAVVKENSVVVERGQSIVLYQIDGNEFKERDRLRLSDDVMRVHTVNEHTFLLLTAGAKAGPDAASGLQFTVHKMGIDNGKLISLKKNHDVPPCEPNLYVCHDQQTYIVSRDSSMTACCMDSLQPILTVSFDRAIQHISIFQNDRLAVSTNEKVIFLPSIQELKIIYQNLIKNELGIINHNHIERVVADYVGSDIPGLRLFGQPAPKEAKQNAVLEPSASLHLNGKFL